MIRMREVIAILDASVYQAKESKFPYIELAKREGKVEQISPDDVKSYIITANYVYASPISSSTLKKRAQSSQKLWK
ncbi:uncharacterized protein DUF370 [Hazenella coriacea]|uniref:Uncharacterized protein DUF370 n=2 Tax=Hazenella coriacea TaxID=1179467 RepID=A0A4R3LDC6_9BACL|nr:uncharacterized protein DUF370 [Hazenella coriacea]